MTFAFWCILAAGLLPILAIVPVKIRRDYDNADPRRYYATLEGLPKRAIAAHQNALEAFPFFAAGVIVAHLGAAPALGTNVLAGAFVLLRLGHIAAYWGDRPNIRSLLWAAGFLVSAALYALPAVAS